MKAILGVYVVIQILILSSLMIMEINVVYHVVAMTLSCITYFRAAFKNVLFY